MAADDDGADVRHVCANLLSAGGMCLCWWFAILWAYCGCEPGDDQADDKGK